MIAYYRTLIVPVVVLLPIIIALCKYGKWKKPEKLSFLYLMLSGFFNMLAAITSSAHVNNLPLLHLYTTLEFCILTMLLRSIFKERKVRNILYGLTIVFPLIAIVYVLYGNNLYSYNTLPRFTSSIVITFFCILYLVLDLTSNFNTKQSDFNFQIIVGLLIYFSSSSVIFLLSEAVRGNNGLNILIWNIHATFVLVMYLIFAWAFFRLKLK